MVTSAMVLFLAVASNVFGAVFTKLGSANLITNSLLAVPLGDWWKLALIMFVFFVLGWPFEWPVIILVFLPIVLPVVEKLQFGLNKLDLLIWFGALTAVNIQTAFLSPPVALSAYYLRNVVPQWSLATIYKGMADYMVIQVFVLIVLLLVCGSGRPSFFPVRACIDPATDVEYRRVREHDRRGRRGLSRPALSRRPRFAGWWCHDPDNHSPS